MSGISQFELSYQLSPIILCNGIAGNLAGSKLPIISITEAQSYPDGVLVGGGPTDVNGYFAYYQPLPGSTLGENEIGTYPFANQAVAANALIAQPLTISMLMICPSRGNGGFDYSLTIMTSLQQSLAQHDALGGTYTIITPKFFYTNCVRMRMVDVSSAITKQAQNTYQIDFKQPLLTLEAAQNAQNSLMSKLTSGAPITGQPTYSGSAASVGQPGSLAGTTLPAGNSTAGGNTALSNSLSGQYTYS